MQHVLPPARSVHLSFMLALGGTPLLSLMILASPLPAQELTTLRAGVAKVDITDYEAGPVNDPLYAKALVLSNGGTTVALVTVDAVAIGEIGPIKNDFLPKVRGALQQAPGLEPTHLLVNASHCHGLVCADTDVRTVQAVREAYERLEPVRIGIGRGHEDRVSENRRLKLKNGREIDVRHAYPLPPDDLIAAVGPIDPHIGLLRLDRQDGSTLAVVYNFACHPIQGVPGGGNTADMIAFSSSVLESALGPDCLALFFQGCGGDINPVRYKDISAPRDAEPLGNLLGLSALKAAKDVHPMETTALQVINERLSLPRADNAEKIEHLEREIVRLTASLRGTTLNIKTFMQLVQQHGLSADFPAYYSHRYLYDEQLGREHLKKFDAANRRDVEAYLHNVHTMEEIVRTRINLALLKKHQATNVAAGSRTLDVELVGLRIGELRLITFPGELTVRIGLNIKQHSPHRETLVAGYTNGYIYYAPTTEQLLNAGGAQEDSDTLLAPDWQEIFETKAADVLRRLQ